MSQNNWSFLTIYSKSQTNNNQYKNGAHFTIFTRLDKDIGEDSRWVHWRHNYVYDNLHTYA